MSLDDRRKRSYERVLQVIEHNNCVPKFSFDSYHGQTKSVNGKTESQFYQVQCKTCGTTFESWFKVAGKDFRMTKCPHCFDGHRSRDLSKEQALRRLQRKNIQLVEGQEFNTVNDSYQVKCLKCGTVFSSTLDKRGINCPYCNESHKQENQVSKLQRICQDEGLDLLSPEYEKQFVHDKRTKFKVKCKTCGTIYEASFIGHKVTTCPTCCVRKVRSNLEKKICDFLSSQGVEFYPNYRLHGLEISKGHPIEFDIYIPSLKIAFEVDGQAYHHSGEGLYSKDKYYHKKKTDLALEHGIKLYHLWDFCDDDLNISIVSAKTGLNKRIFARNCELKEIPAKDANQFLVFNHVDGYARSTKYYGLFYQDELVAVSTLMNRMLQASKISKWEIGRFATKRYTTVVGGYSKLLKRMISDLKEMGVDYLMSYCNRDISPDEKETFYYKQGFEFLEDAGPIYWYWASKAFDYLNKHFSHGAKVSRQTFQKQKLLKHYEQANLELPIPCTEATLAANLGCKPCYNSGNFKYKLTL